MVSKTLPAHLQSGRNAEKLANRYLQKQGLQLVTQNYRCRQGEIDLVMRDDNTLVFVEVKFRHNEHWMPIIESVTRKKRWHLIQAGERYLQHFDVTAEGITECRFDIVLILGSPASIRWLPAAFDADEFHR